MELAILVARIAAVLFLVIGIAGLIDKKYYEKVVKEVFKNAGTALTLGTLTLIVGMLIVSYHNVWSGWSVIVTLIGWIGLAKGVTIVLFPKHLEKTSLQILGGSLKSVIPYVTCVLGLLMGYFGFL